MTETETFSLVLEDGAKTAVTNIARLLGAKVSKEEAVQRALGTELYLLEQVKSEGAKVFLQFKNGERAEVDLFG